MLFTNLQLANRLKRIWTIGHSTRDIDDFISLLNENSIKVIADVRMFPGSRRYPHFGSEALANSLREHGIGYDHFPELGGRRKAKPDSKNTAWRNESFRGYADYMETEDFRKGIERLAEVSNKYGRAAIMCAEAVWWRCHRSLISDYLKANGVDVLHILDHKKVEPHPFTSAAKIVNGQLNYADESLFPSLSSVENARPQKINRRKQR
jgi:uncharacterized protein (DUF488 family)